MPLCNISHLGELRNICILPKNIKLPGARNGMKNKLEFKFVFLYAMFSCLISFLEDLISHTS